MEKNTKIKGINTMNLNINKKSDLQQKILKKNKVKLFQNINYNSANINLSNTPNLSKKHSNKNSNIIDYNNNVQNQYNIPDSSESLLSTKIYEKNIILLNDKIKEQENNIIYLNNRLKNYDITLDEISKLNIELNKLNGIIRTKNNTIHEFRDITDLSKNKIEKLIKNKNELLEKIKFLENENKKLKESYQNYNYNSSLNNNNYSERNHNFIKKEDYNKLKFDLNEIIEENKRLKSKINEKDDEIQNLKNIIDNLKNEKNLKSYENYHNINNYNDYKDRNNFIDFNSIYKGKEKFIKVQPHNNLRKINNITRRDISMQNRSITPIITNINDKYGIYLKNDYNKNDYSFKTEPNSVLNLTNSHSKKILTYKNKYNYLKNKYSVSPLDYSNYLLDNLNDNIINNYNKIKL